MVRVKVGTGEEVGVFLMTKRIISRKKGRGPHLTLEKCSKGGTVS